MKISVKSLKDRKTFDVEVQHTMTAADVKGVIESQEGVPANAQRLVFSGRPLKDDATLSDSGVQKGATLHLVLRLKTYIELSVRVMSGKTIDLESAPNATARARPAAVAATSRAVARRAGAGASASKLG